MGWFFEQSRFVESPDLILHLGAGVCQELDDYRALKPARIVLVEPNPELLFELGQRTASTDNVQIIESAVSRSPDDNRLTILSDPRLSSLREPTRLFTLMPGLKEERQVQVTSRSVTELVDVLSLSSSKTRWLVVETPGVEGEIIDCLKESGQLRNFCRLFLRAGVEPLYDGARPIAAILPEILDAGFSMISAADEADPDQPIYHLQLDGSFAENQGSSTEVATVETETGRPTDHLRMDSSFPENRRLRNELSKVRKELEQKISDAQKQLGDRDELLESLTAELREVERKLKLQMMREFDLEDELDKVRKELEQKLSDAENQLRDRDDLIKSLKAQLQEVEHKMKLQMLRDSDLEELQQRYGELLNLKNRQTALLASVKEKMDSVVTYVDQLGAEDDSQTRDDVAATVLNVISGITKE